MGVSVRYCKKTPGRFKAEYVFDEAFATEFLKTAMSKLFLTDGFEFEKIELADDTSIFDGGIRLACSELSESKEFIDSKLNDDITSVALYGKYNGSEVCLVVLKEENVVRTSCRKDVDLSGLTDIFCVGIFIMSLEELEHKLLQEDLIKDKFSIGRASDNRYCIVCENNEWLTFYYEKGKRTRLNIYASEAAACADIYKCMMKVKGRLEKSSVSGR